ncbi:MAG: HlyC/CorC family transporter [Chitinophagales bacterium]|nr:HlyC/CorC family transporter [Chitinophagales bacterium]
MTLLLTILFLILSAVFSGMEIAFVSSNKLRIELNKETGKLANRIIAAYNEDGPTFITALLIGNNIALILFSAFMSILIDADTLRIDPNNQFILLLVAQTALTTIVVLIFGEFFPKALFRISPYRSLLLFAVPFKFLVYWFLKPIAYVFSWLSTSLIKLLLPNSFNEDQIGFSSVDLEYYIKELAAGQIAENEEDDINSDIFEKALYLKETKVKECMVPRTELHGLDKESTIEELRLSFIETKLSRLLIFEENIDNVIGYVHHIDILKKPKSIAEVIYPIMVVPETMNARDLLTLFTKENKNMAHVVDEYGGTAGLVTLEDLIEEIFGEIQDEHDEDEFIEKQIDDNAYVFSGRLEIDLINEKYKLDIPLGDYETLAGYVVVRHEAIPAVNETIILDNFEILVLDASDNRIETLQIKKLAKKDD